MDKDSDKVVLETKGEVEEQEKRKGINKDKSNQGLCLFIPPPLYLYITHIQYGRILDYPWIFLNRRIKKFQESPSSPIVSAKEFLLCKTIGRVSMAS